MWLLHDRFPTLLFTSSGGGFPLVEKPLDEPSDQLAAVIGAVLWLCSLGSFGYFLIYGQEFSQSVIFIMFESNVAESREYLVQYFAWWMLPAFLAYGLGGWLLWRKVRPVYLSRPGAWLAAALALFVSLGYPAIRQFSKHE